MTNTETNDAVVEAEFDSALLQLIRATWNIVLCGDSTEPDVVVAYRRHKLWADVIALRGHDRAAAYRTLLLNGDDPLATDHVVWHYLSDAAHTIRAGLTVPPDTLAVTPYPIPDNCRVPEVNRRPLTIRLPSHAGTGPVPR